MRPFPSTLGLVLVVLAAGGCAKEKLVASNCRVDDDCQAGFLCENYTCVPKDAKRCDAVTAGNPILQPSPHTVEFGTLDNQGALVETVSLVNIGNCALTLFDAKLLDTSLGFTCDLCDTSFPKEIFPGRSIDLTVGFAATSVKQSKTMLELLSDDHEYPTLDVPVQANYIGTPQLVAAPAMIDFGYLPQNTLLKRTLQLTNQGTGTAPIIVQSLSLDPPATMDFSFVDPMNLPRSLPPIAVDSSGLISLEVRYTPRTLDTHTADLVVTTNLGVVRVPLKGTSATPPKIAVTPGMIDLGDVPLGTSSSQTLTVVNSGGAPLIVTPHWSTTTMMTTDLSTSPQIVPPVAAGTYVDLQVVITATQTGAYNTILLVDSNDPNQPSLSIPVHANGVPGQGPQVVKVEMTFDNGTDGLFDNDIRDVDLTLEHPYGYVCNKRNAMPTNWGNFGTCTWLAFAPKEEPERIVLANAMQDGTWRVMVTYMQDCKSIPTGLLAGLLGISVDVLQQVLTGGVIIPGQNVGSLIANVCLDHSSTGVSVKVFVNGLQVAERPTTLGKTGDSTYVLDLVRANSVFTVQ
jgi:hypothetical protein